MRQLKVGQKDNAPVARLESEFVVAQQHVDGERQFARVVNTGVCDVCVSVGTRDGTPTFALPLQNGDGKNRYTLGQIQFLERTASN